MRVRFTPSARIKFLEALEFIRKDDPNAAMRLHDRVAEVSRLLTLHPGIGHGIPEFPESRYRQIVVRPYRLFYRAGSDVIVIVGVWHARQIPKPPQ